MIPIVIQAPFAAGHARRPPPPPDRSRMQNHGGKPGESPERRALLEMLPEIFLSGASGSSGERLACSAYSNGLKRGVDES